MSDTATYQENIKEKIGIEYFNKKDTCQLANVSSRTIDNYTKKNIISAKRYENKNYYSLSDIEILRNKVTLNKRNLKREKVEEIEKSVKPKEIDNTDHKSKANKIKIYTDEIDKLRHIIDDYAEENATLTKQVNKLILSIGEKDTNLNSNKDNIESFKRDIGKLQTEIAVLRERVREKEQVISEYKKENLALNEEVLKAQADIVELTTTRNNAKEAFNNLVGQIKGIVEEASNKSSEIAELRVYKENYLQVLAKLAKLEQDRQAEHGEEVRRLMEVNSELNDKCDKLMKQADQYQVLILDKVESKRIGNTKYNTGKKLTFKERIKRFFKSK